MIWKDKFPKESRYFETKNGILYCADCLEIMKGFPKESIDLVLTDPPYGLKQDKGSKDFGIAKQKKYSDEWDNNTPPKKYFDIILSLSRVCIIFGGNLFTDKLPIGEHWIVWDKVGGIKFKNPFSQCELLWTNIKRKPIKKYVCIQQGFIRDSREKRCHPTQKPLLLIKQLLEDYSDETNLVLDPFLGSGTTAVACEKLNRRWIGIEISEEYCKIAKERIEQERKQLKLGL